PMLHKLSLIVALAAAFACSPALATEMNMGHHACGANKKMADCKPMHHYMGHHACKEGNKKSGHCMH
ncbi:MAG: hypothetical protein WA150_01765, partial [Methylovirgula sp.]